MIRHGGMLGAVCIAASLLCCAAHPARAAGSSVSYSTWIVSADTVMLRFVLPAAEAERLTGVAIPVLTVSKLGDYVLDRMEVTAAGHVCPAIDQGYDLGKVDPVQVGRGLYGFEIVFRCGAPMRSLVLEDRALFDRVPGHVSFARIEAGGHVTEQLFTASRERLPIESPADVPAAGIGRYMQLGALHILGSADRLCFLVATLLLVRGRRDAAQTVLALAGGYALSLLAQASGLLLPEEAMVEAFVGFLIALAAIAAAAGSVAARRHPAMLTAGWPLLLVLLAAIAAGVGATRPALVFTGAACLSTGFLAAVRGPQARSGLRLLPAATLGFLDGFAFPSIIAPLRLPDAIQTRLSAGYDFGALAVDAAVVAVLAGAWALLSRGRVTLPGPAMGALAAVLGGIGTFWLVSRIYA